jgi:peptide/nickel transport system substrate-binding protein
MEDGEADPEYWAWGSVHNIAGGIVPWHVAEQQGYDWDDPDDVGEYFTWLHEVPPTWSGGPFQVVAEESQLGDRVIWEPNPNWYGEPVSLDTVVIRYLTDDNGWSDALANGEMHGASPPDLNPDVLEQLQNQNDVSMHITDGPSWEHLDVNLEHSQLAELELRRAIFTAVDVEDIADANFGEVYPDVRVRRNYSFHQDHPFFEDVLEGTGFGSGDIEAARQILADAGYEGYEDGETLTKDGERIGPFRLSSTDTAPRNNAKLLVQDYLSQIGIQVTIESTDQLGSTLGSGDYDLMIFGWSGPSSLFATDAFQWGHSASSSNFGHYSDPDYDAAAQRAAVATSPEEAAAALNEAYRISAGEAYVLPFYDTPVYIFAIGDYVNLRDNGNNSVRALYNVGEWGVAVE